MREAAPEIGPELGPEVSRETPADRAGLTQHHLLPRSHGWRQPGILSEIAGDASSIAAPRGRDVAVSAHGEH